MKKLIILLLILVVFLTGCTQENDNIIKKCIDLCKQQKIDLNNGPCLSNEIEQGWVCDVAHSPRQNIDNLQENQCRSFREGKTNHFIEVTPSCEFIRKV
jgi:thioredoxin-related protein